MGTQHGDAPTGYPFFMEKVNVAGDAYPIGLHIIPTRLPHQTPENFPVCGEILKSGTDRVTVQQNIIPTRCRNLHLKQFCLEIICSYSSDCFDYPYYLSYTMDAYQNLISVDKLRKAVWENRFGWLSTQAHIS